MTTEDRRRKIGSSLLKWRILLRRRVQYTLDLVVLATAFVLSYLLRFDFDIPEDMAFRSMVQIHYVILIQFTALVLTGVHAFIWRFTGMAEIRAFIKAAIISLLPLLLLRLLLPESLAVFRVPLSVIMIDTTLAFGGMLGLRVLRRELYEKYEKRQKSALSGNESNQPVLLIGAGRAGVLAAREILGRGDMGMQIKGFLDDDPSKLGSVVQGIKVLGATEDLPRLASELCITRAVITIAEASGIEIRRIINICEQANVKAQIIPGLFEILQGRVEVSRIRDVQVEDLLGREPVNLDEQNLRSFLAGKTAMVTGAGGSIGSELVRQIARFQPSKILLVERAECALFNIDSELREAMPELNIIPLVADVGDVARMRSIFYAYRPQVVLHAAAHKHVPMMESNVTEAIKNNVLATRLLGEIAGEFEVETFVLISTDKAVRPTSVMGASKRVAELAVQGLNKKYPTRYVAVRFGNVIGSAGSVIPIFREQILKGGPVTVTHEEMMRYFMTIPEAAQLVLQAGAMGDGGEIFILDMGEPVRILELAKDTITLSGLKPYEDIDIVITGMRPGEKLFEEFEISEEQMTRTRHPKIFIGRIASLPEEKVRYALSRLSILAMDGAERELRGFLNGFIPEARLSNVELASGMSEKEVQSGLLPFISARVS